MMRGMAERNTQAQMAQGPSGLAQRAQTQPTSALHMPQMAPPLHQPLPGQPSTPYRQAVQLPGKTVGRGVTSHSCVNKTAPTGGQGSQDHGRPISRGHRDGGRSFSHPRGVQGKGSVQLPCQEGDLPSGSMPSVPPPVAPEGTQPQQGGWPKTSPRDPA